MADKQRTRALVFGSALLAAGAVGTAQADANPFQSTALAGGYDLANAQREGNCGEGKCGGEKKDGEGKSGGEKKDGEGKCGGEAKGAGSKSGEGKCGAR